MESSIAGWLQELLTLIPEGLAYFSLLFLIALFESLPLVGLIMPGSTLLVFAGFLVLHDKGTLLTIIIAATLGGLVGDIISFWLGGRFGSQLLLRKSFRKHRRLIQRSELFFAAHGGKSIFFARFFGPLRGVTPFIGGIARMKGPEFLRYALVSAVLWGIAYPGVGFIGGASWQQAQSLSLRLGLLILLALAVTLLHTWLRRRLQLSSGEKDHGN